MFDYENKVTFRRDRNSNLTITYHCGKCNTILQITDLVNALLDYGQDDCPSHLYQAWKVLRLGSSEYADNPHQPELEHGILEAAIKHI